MPTNNYDLNTPAEGTTDWHVPLNENFESLDSLLYQLETDGSINDGGVRHALEFSGENGGEMIQAAIDDADSSDGKNVVVVDNHGPDSNGSWLLNEAIRVPGNTCLILESTRLVLSDGSDDNILRNENIQNGDSDITILGRGTVLDHAGANQTRQNTYNDNCITLINVDSFLISGLVIRNAESRSIQTEGSSNGTIRDIQVRGRKALRTDAVHITGPATKIAVSGIIGETGDDFLAADATPHPHSAYGDGGDVSNISFSNCHYNSIKGGGLLRTASGASFVCDGIILENSTIGNGQPALRLGGNDNPDKSQHKNILVNNVFSESKGIECYHSVMNLYVSQMNAKGGLLDNDQQNMENVQLTNCVAREMTGPAIKITGGTVNNLQMTGISVHDNGTSSSTGIGFSGSSTAVSNIQASNILFSGCDTGVSISSAVSTDSVSLDNISGEQVNNMWDVDPGDVIINNTTVESSNAELPQGDYAPGTVVVHNDSGDGTGSGTYLLTPTLNWVQIST